MKLTAIQLDETKEREGVSRTFPGSDIVLWTRRAWSPEFRDVFNRERRKLADPETGRTSEDQDARARFLAYCEVCFARWENVQGAIVDGAYVPTDDPLPYTPEVGMALFNPDKGCGFETLYTFWSAIAETQEHYRVAQTEADGKKPAPTSDGSSSTDHTNDST